MDKHPYIALLLLVIIAMLLGPLCNSIGFAADPFQVIETSPEDATAVIKTADGNLQTIKVGDIVREYRSPVPGHELVTTEITDERIVFEDRTDPETVILRLDGGAYKLEKIKTRQEAQPMLYAPK